jgi:hypothetical protein
MEQNLLILTSGFIGAILGAYVAIRINSANRKVAAVEKMLSLVYRLGFKSWWNPDQGKPAIIFHDNYPELWSAYAALRATLPFWKRKEFDKAWHSYMAIDYYDQISEDQHSKVFQKGTHRTKEEAVEKSAEFIRYLVTLR